MADISPYADLAGTLIEMVGKEIIVAKKDDIINGIEKIRESKAAIGMQRIVWDEIKDFAETLINVCEQPVQSGTT